MKRLGEILLDWGVVAVSELHTGLEACRRTGGRLGTQLLKFGFVDEMSLLEALSEQHGVQSATARMLRRAPDEIRKLLPPRVARRLQAVPFGRTADGVKVAMTTPRDLARVEEISEIMNARIEPFVATESAILGVIDEFDQDLMEVVVEPDPGPRSEQVSSFEWEQLWASPQPHPDRLLRLRPRHHASDGRPLVSTFPGLAPVLEGSSDEENQEIDELAFRERLAQVRHRDEVGSLLLRFTGRYLDRLCLFSVHRGWVAGWMARGQGAVVDDVQSLSMSLDRPSVFRDFIGGADRYVGPIPPGGDNDALARVMGEPEPLAIMLLPVRVKEHTVAFLVGDNPGEDSVTVPVEELVAAAQKAGAAFETLIIRKKILG